MSTEPGQLHREQVRSYEETFPGGLSLPTVITDKASHTEATEALRQAKYGRDRDEVLLGRALDADAKEGDTFAKLARYETRIERSLFRSLYELGRVQDERRNRPSSPIVDAVTLDVKRYPVTSFRQMSAYRRSAA